MCGPEESAQDEIIAQGRIMNFSSFSNEEIEMFLPEFREVISPLEGMNLREGMSAVEVYGQIFNRGHFFRTAILPSVFSGVMDELVVYFGGYSEVIFISPEGEINRLGKKMSPADMALLTGGTIRLGKDGIWRPVVSSDEW